jgi:polar amino acid transport system permease protein
MTALSPYPSKATVVAETEKSRLPPLFGFRTRLYLTWATLLGLCAMFFMSFDLKFSIILEKLPNLVGLHLGPNGFLQGAALTLFL